MIIVIDEILFKSRRELDNFIFLNLSLKINLLYKVKLKYKL